MSPELYFWRISVSTSSEAVDAVTVLLSDAGFDGAEIEDPADWTARTPSPGEGQGAEPDPEREDIATVRVYAHPDSWPGETAEGLARRVSLAVAPAGSSGLSAGALSVEVDTVSEEDFAEAWKAYYHPVEVPGGLVVVPAWEAEPWLLRTDRTVIVLDPGMAFGTGAHETTRLCLKKAARLVRPDDAALDIGTGSGVLAVAAAKLGASRVLAVDVDPAALRSALDAARRNGVQDRVEVRFSNLLNNTGDQPFDLVFANLLEGLVAQILPGLAQRLKENGRAVLSGLAGRQADRIVRLLSSCGLALSSSETLGEWTALTVRRADDPLRAGGESIGG